MSSQTRWLGDGRETRNLSDHYPVLEEAREWDDAIVEFKQSYPLKKSEMENLVAAIARIYMDKNRSRIRITTMHEDTIYQLFICIPQPHEVGVLDRLCVRGFGTLDRLASCRVKQMRA